MNADEQYVPTEGDVRARYVLAGLPDCATSDQIARVRDREAPEFDRFLARVRRDAYDWGRHDERMSLAYAPPSGGGGPAHYPETKD